MKSLKDFLNERNERNEPSSVEELNQEILQNLEKRKIRKVEKEKNRQADHSYFYTVHYEDALTRGRVDKLMKQHLDIQWIAPSDVKGCIAIKYAGSYGK